MPPRVDRQPLLSWSCAGNSFIISARVQPGSTAVRGGEGGHHHLGQTLGAVAVELPVQRMADDPLYRIRVIGEQNLLPELSYLNTIPAPKKPIEHHPAMLSRITVIVRRTLT